MDTEGSHQSLGVRISQRHEIIFAIDRHEIIFATLFRKRHEIIVAITKASVVQCWVRLPYLHQICGKFFEMTKGNNYDNYINSTGN